MIFDLIILIRVNFTTIKDSCGEQSRDVFPYKVLGYRI
jgi:hypothetical protein